MSLLIKNGRVIDPANKTDDRLDILIEDRKIRDYLTRGHQREFGSLCIMFLVFILVNFSYISAVSAEGSQIDTVSKKEFPRRLIISGGVGIRWMLHLNQNWEFKEGNIYSCSNYWISVDKLFSNRWTVGGSIRSMCWVTEKREPPFNKIVSWERVGAILGSADLGYNIMKSRSMTIPVGLGLGIVWLDGLYGDPIEGEYAKDINVGLAINGVIKLHILLKPTLPVGITLKYEITGVGSVSVKFDAYNARAPKLSTFLGIGIFYAW
jgi:hypothetical protein